MKKEFQELWNKINIKTVYEVSFDKEDLINKAVNSINDKLIISKPKIKITEGSQKNELTSVLINSGESMTETKTTTEIIDYHSSSHIKYDLVGEITNETNLTRKTIITILSKIDEAKFNMYKDNPEEFIRRVSTIINNTKAIIVVDKIKYHKTDQKYPDSIFTLNNVRGELGKNAIAVKKHIYDYLVTDSKVELNFAQKLESGEVSVYAKLPPKFKIPTPVGNYNPDWAIVLNNKSFKYIYFIAETKGSLDSMELREVEKAKIECARKHFECLNNDDVKYDVVDDYDSLIEFLTT